MNFIAFLYSTFTAFLVSSLMTRPASAALDAGDVVEPAAGSVEFPSPFGNATITDVINRIIDYAIVIAASFAALMVLYGAFQILSSSGDSKKVTAGKQTIVYALGGLIVVILARGLVAIFKGLVIGLGA